MANLVDLEPQAKAVVDANANPPYLFELGPDQGRRTVDAVQAGPVKIHRAGCVLGDRRALSRWSISCSAPTSWR